MDVHRTKWCENIAENFNPLSRAHERYRRQRDRQTDGRTTTYSERELTIANVNVSSYVRLKRWRYCVTRMIEGG